QHVRPILQQGHEPNLGESAGTSTGTRTTEGLVVLRSIGDIQGTAIQTDQSPLSVPSPLGALLRNGSYHRVIQFLQRRGAQTAARLRNAGFTGYLQLGGRIEQPLHAFQQATQYFTIGGP